jgi:acyl-CoA synthetase (AMP-forming)/AMP-acid ligase II
VPDTIPGLLAAAADRDPAGVWLRTDEGTLSFGNTANQVARLAERLRDAGVRRGDLVVVTTRTTPPYLMCWLALGTIGAVTVPTDPSGTPGELAGLVGQVDPRLLVTDVDLLPLVEEAGVGGLPELGVLDIHATTGDWRVADRADRRSLPIDVGPDDLAVLIPT